MGGRARTHGGPVVQNYCTYLRIAGGPAIFIISCSAFGPIQCGPRIRWKERNALGEGWSATKHLRPMTTAMRTVTCELKRGRDSSRLCDVTKCRMGTGRPGLDPVSRFQDARWLARPVGHRVVCGRGPRSRKSSAGGAQRKLSVVFDYTGVTFGYLEDLDGDGMPEAILHSLSLNTSTSLL